MAFPAQLINSGICFLCSSDEWSDKASQNSSTFDEGGGSGDIDPDSACSATASSKPKKQPKVQNVAARRKDHLNIVFIGHVGQYIWIVLSAVC